MKLGARDIQGFLNAPEARTRAALLYGPDSGLVRERAKLIKAAVLGESGDPFAFVELSGSDVADDPARLADEILAIGFSPKRFLLVRDAGEKLATILKELAPTLHEGVYLVLTAGELQTRSALRAWFEAEPNVAALPCYRDEMRDVQAIVQKSFSEIGILAGRDVIDYLAGQLGNNREVTRSELEKIITYAGEEKRLSLEDAQTLVDYNRDTPLDDIVNAAADKAAARLDALLKVQLMEGTSPVAYLRALQRYFNRLYFIKARAQAGYDIESVIQGLRPKVFFKQVPLLTRHARNWSLPSIVRALQFLISAELAIKSSDVPAEAASTRRLFQLAQLR